MLRLQVSYDLTAFLPPPSTPAQSVLSDRLGQGPGTQLIFVALSDKQATEVQAIAAQIRSSAHFSRVLPEEVPITKQAIPQSLWRHRLLLGDLPDNAEQWQEILAQRTDDLMFGGDQDLLQLIAADPSFLALEAIDRFGSAVADPTFHFADQHILLVQSRAAGFDIEAQTAAVSALRAILGSDDQVKLYGSPVYGVDLQATVRQEATLFSVAASIALLIFVIFRFRTWHRVLGVALPVACGAAAGVCALTLAFDTTHGITLAFGFTLLGIAIDYPLHVYSHQLEKDENTHLWPTMRLGIASTLVAYIAFLFSGTEGLQQLGLFASVGIIVAALVCAFLTARPTGPEATNSPVDLPSEAIAEPQRDSQLTFLPSLAVATVGIIGLLNTSLFADDLSTLTPVDPAILETDVQLRASMGVTDARYIISIHTQTLEENLQANESIVEQFYGLLTSGLLEGFRSISEILPSQATQQRRVDLLQHSQALKRFNEAADAAGFQPEAFAPFTDLWRAWQQNPKSLSIDDLKQDPQLNALVESSLYENQAGWTGLIYLQGIHSVTALQAEVAQIPSATLIDLKATANSMVAGYRERLLTLLGLALAVVTVLIGSQLRLMRALWSLSTVAATVLFTGAVSAWMQSGLSLFDIMALALVAGLGLDYALFYGLDGDQAQHKATKNSVQVCAISSLLVFSILAFSSIPVLHGLGLTVSVGVSCAYLLARYGRYTKAPN